jgi:hypothetical protein
MSRSSVIVLALALLAPGLAARPSAAAWPHDPNSGNVPVCTAALGQLYPVTVPDAAGGAIVVWATSAIEGNFHLYAQRISATGAPLWTTDGVALCTATGGQSVPVIASDGAGGALVTWSDYRSGSADIYAQRINAAGATQWAANGVALCTATGNQSSPSIVADGAGGAIVSWYDPRDGNAHIYAQRVNAVGATQWTANGVALCTATGNQVNPAIATDDAGGAIVLWRDTRSGTINIYAQRVSAAGAPQWTTNGLRVCTAAGSQDYAALVADGSGGALVSWIDERSAGSDVYAQRVGSGGVLQWGGSGIAVCTATNAQFAPVLVSDGSGGAIIAWLDGRSVSYEPYAQRVNAGGARLWATDGIPLCAASGVRGLPTIASDGAGGAIVAWQDSRSGAGSDIYAQRASATGAALWTWDGVPVSTALGDQAAPVIATDASGGAIVAWHDSRGGTSTDIYAQRIERFGVLGSPEPAIVNVKDYPLDQGGKVRIQWSASYLDADPSNSIASYSIWRQAPSLTAAVALRTGAATLPADGTSPASASRALYRTTLTAAGTYYWEFLASQTAQGFPGYSYVAATGADSVGAGNPYTRYMIEAVGSTYAGSTPHWSSAPDSGYSVDNLAPATPAPFTGQYVAGVAYLAWHPNPDADLAGYRLYRGASAGFTPNAGNFVGALSSTDYADAAGAPFVYKLCAVDSHGNTSPFATLLPSGTLGVGDVSPHDLSFAAPIPNPARGAAGLEFTLTRAGRVRLSAYDAAGRRVRLVRDGELPAGAHRENFDLRDDAGHELASGLYVLVLEAEGRSITRRLAAIR